MSISSEIRRAGPFAGNGTTVNFPFVFKIFNTAQVVVTRSVGDVDTTLLLTTHYTVTLNSNQEANPGGVVTLLTAPPLGHEITLTSGVANLQPTNLANLGGFYPEVINDSLDRATMQIQQLDERLDRTLALSVSSTGISTVLPNASPNEFLAWNNLGTALENAVPSLYTVQEKYVAAAGQLVFFLQQQYEPNRNNLEVFVDGLRLLRTEDYIESTSSAVTFVAPRSAGQEVVFLIGRRLGTSDPGPPVNGLVYVRTNGDDANDGRTLGTAVKTIARGLQIANGLGPGHVVSVYPGSYIEDGDLAIGPGNGVVSVGGQYTTNIFASAGNESKNMFLLSSGSYVQGFGFRNQSVDSFDDPTGGFAVAFAPGATIFRSPYVRDISQVSQYLDQQIVEPLGPEYPEIITIAGTAVGGTAPTNNVTITVATVSGTGGVLTFTSSGTAAAGTQTYTAVTGTASKFGTGAQFTVVRAGGVYTVTVTTAGSGYYAQPNPILPRGGGTILADRAVLNQNSVFPYILAFGATPRSPNGIGYCAKNGAGINGISSVTIFQRIAFYALNGGQITLNNSGTQFGDVSFRSRGSMPVQVPVATSAGNLVASASAAAAIATNRQAVIDAMWLVLVTAGYTAGQPASYETFTRRDAGNLLDSLRFDFLDGDQKVTQAYALGFFDYKGDLVFDYNQLHVPSSTTLGFQFQAAWDAIKIELYNYAPFDVAGAPRTMLDALIGIVKNTVDPSTRPAALTFSSLIESLAHQFNNAGSGVNANALPLNFRRTGSNQPVPFTILAEAGTGINNGVGRVRWSGADELNNQYFAGGTKINGLTGRIEGRPFANAVRQIARRVSNSQRVY